MDFKQEYVRLVALSIQKTREMQNNPMRQEDFADAAKTYAIVANMIYNGRGVLFKDEPEEEIKEVVQETEPSKEDLKNKPVEEKKKRRTHKKKEEPKEEEVKEETAPEVQEQEQEQTEPIQETTSEEKTKPEEKEQAPEESSTITMESLTDEQMEQTSQIITQWLRSTSKETPSISLITNWASQIIGKQVENLEELDSAPQEQVDQFMVYAYKWAQLLKYWTLDQTKQVLALVTKNERTKLEEVSPDNINLLIAFTEQKVEELKKEEEMQKNGKSPF